MLWLAHALHISNLHLGAHSLALNLLCAASESARSRVSYPCALLSTLTTSG